MEIETEFGRPKERETTYRFLYRLQAGGSINMYGAPKVLQDTFGLSRKLAYQLFKDWTENWKQSSFEQAKGQGDLTP